MGRFDFLDGYLRRLISKSECDALEHPIKTLNALDGYGAFLESTEYDPSLASMALFLGTSKEMIYSKDQDVRKYLFFDVRNSFGDVVEFIPIMSVEEIDGIRDGVDVDLTQVVSLDVLINRHEARTGESLTKEEKKSMYSLKGAYIKLFNRGGIKGKLSGKWKYNRDRDWVVRNVLNRQCVGLKELYTMIVRGSIVVRQISFTEIFRAYKQVSESEWIKSGKDARNPAMSIFMLMNQSGYAPVYQNKQTTEYISPQSVLDEAEYQKRLDSLITGFIDGGNKVE